MLAAPHVPDEFSEADALSLLNQLTYGILYYCIGERTFDRDFTHRDVNFPGSTHYKIKEVKGICWLFDHLRQTEAEAATVYINGSPYAVPLNWLRLTDSADCAIHIQG